MQTTTEETTYTLRVWDDGYSETYDVDPDDDFGDRAHDEWSKGDWGEGDYRITYSWEVTEESGAVIDSGSGEIEHEREEPECPESSDGHEWTSEHEGGLSENPGVWSLSGTKMKFLAHCQHCGMSREQIVTGSQFNPGECDTTEYGDPDPDWVAEHYAEKE